MTTNTATATVCTPIPTFTSKGSKTNTSTSTNLPRVGEFAKTIDELAASSRGVLAEAGREQALDAGPQRERLTASDVALVAVGDRQLGLEARVLLAQPLILGAHRLEALSQ